MEEQAGWRDRKAEEYPEDERNAKSAHALRRVAEHVRSLPDDAPPLAGLDEYLEIHEQHGWSLGESISAQGFSRIGFGNYPLLDTPEALDREAKFAVTLVLDSLRAYDEEGAEIAS